MKKLISVLLLTLLNGCGVTDTLRDDCGSDIKMLCNAIFGYTDRRDIDRLQDSELLQNERLRLLEERLGLVEQSINLDSTNISQGLQQLETQVNIQITQINNDLALVNTAIQLLASQTQVDQIEAALTAIRSRLDALEEIESTQVAIVEVCPQVSGANIEVLLQVGGEFMALLDGTIISITNGNGNGNGNNGNGNGNNRGSVTTTRLNRLVKLSESTNYITTDGRNVTFSVADGEITCQ